MKFEVLEPQETVNLFSFLGVKNSFFEINIYTILYTWIAMIFLVGGGLIARHYLKKENHPTSYIFQQAIIFLADLCAESIGFFKYEYFAFVGSMFFFTLACNLIGILPFCQETTKDINTTFALGISAFLFVQYQGIKYLGLRGYLKTFVEPVAFLLPLEVVGKLASILSMSFRLFGNILGGAIVYSLLVTLFEGFSLYYLIFTYLILFIFWIVSKKVNLFKIKILKYFFYTSFFIIFLLSGAQMFFGVFEGFIQAFVITMLAITYLSVALAHGSHDDEHLTKEEKC